MSLISVIVPVYNAEKSIERCLKSILCGSYRHIEIIVINDGSTDSTKDLLNRLALTDPRLRVFHCETNMGLAAARNMGLEQSLGDLITWCDADDYVEPEWLSHQYESLVQYDADISICRACCERGDDITYPRAETELFDAETALEAYFEHKKINGILWTKLFRADLIKDKRIPDGIRYMEDEVLIWQVIGNVRRIVRTAYVDYHFVISKDSTLGQPINSKRVMDIIDIFSGIYAEVQTRMPRYKEDALRLLIDNALGCCTLLYRYGITAERMSGLDRLKTLIRSIGLRGIARAKGGKGKLLYLSLLLGIRLPVSAYRFGKSA